MQAVFWAHANSSHTGIGAGAVCENLKAIQTNKCIAIKKSNNR